MTRVDRSPDQTARPCAARGSWEGYLLVGVSVIALCVLGFGGGHLPPRAAASKPASCSIAQKKPLFVGFAEGAPLDDFEGAVFASRELYHGAKTWLCESSSDNFDAIPHTRSLHAALMAQHALRVEQIQFDHPSLERAHIELLDLATQSETPRGWRIHLQRADGTWQVTRADDTELPVHDNTAKTP